MQRSRMLSVAWADAQPTAEEGEVGMLQALREHARAVGGRLAVAGLVLAFVATGCGTGADPDASAGASDPGAPSATATQDGDPEPTESMDEPDETSLDDLYQAAVEEGGVLTCYCAINERVGFDLYAAFSERFPDVQVEHINATSTDLASRALTESAGGSVQGDLFYAEVEFVEYMNENALLAEWTPPESEAYDDALKSDHWLASDIAFITISWNTDLVSADEEPTGFEDLADPRWQGRIIGEPRDAELLVGLAEGKYGGDQDRALELMEQIAANEPQFHNGHSALTQLLLGGQAALCFTCYAHHYPSEIEAGAPVDFLLTEGVGFFRAYGMFEDAPHPNTAMLFWRWAASEEGQAALAEAGLEPAHPAVEAPVRTRPDEVYLLGQPELQLLVDVYEPLWDEVFGLR